jgi:carbamoyltransferase
MTHVYLGRNFSDKEIEVEIIKAKFVPIHVGVSDRDLVQYVAQLLADGGVVGWFQGRSEWGARALGSRSILADPTRPNMKKIVNEKIKFREPFRPFAPAVVVERAHEFFDLNGCADPSAPENFMLLVCAVREQAKEHIPAVTHVDGTARVQVVRSEINPLFHALIEEFGVLTGLPVLLNTSFNLRGEPIVDSPADAIRTFSWSDMDYLVMGRYVIKKEYRM